MFAHEWLFFTTVSWELIKPNFLDGQSLENNTGCGDVTPVSGICKPKMAPHFLSKLQTPNEAVQGWFARYVQPPVEAFFR